MMRDTAGSAEQLQIDCLDSAAAFDQLQAIWQGLERQDPQCTPFNTWVWNSLWWHHYGTARDRLTLLIARQGNRVVGLAPLYIHATRMCKVVPVKVLRFIGTGGDASPDYLNIVALPKFRNAAERAFLDFLTHIKGWQKLHLANMLQSSSLAGRVRKFVITQPGMALSPLSQISQRAALPATFDAYRMQLGRKHCKQINDWQNHLAAAGVSELSICATTEELDEANDALDSLYLLGCESKQEESEFRNIANEQFHRAVIRHFFAMDALWLATMKLDGKIIGVQYIFVWRGELMFMQSGYSPEHESLSSGQVLLTYVIQRGIEQGMTGLDMLKGQHSYRSTYDRDQIYTVNHGFFRPGVHRFIGGACDWAARSQSTTRPVQGADTNS